MSAPDLDLDALLGVSFPSVVRKPKGKVVECGQKAPVLRQVVEHHNLRAFELTGYVAKVTRLTCLCCDDLWDRLEGIFIEERHLPSGTRRLQQMSPKGDFPMGGGHRKEVEEAEVKFCAGCVGDLGFDREVDAKGQPFTHTVRE